MPTSLVRAYSSSSAHSLGCTQVTHKVVVLQHTLHTVGKGNGDGQWQALRDSNHLHSTPSFNHGILQRSLIEYVQLERTYMKITKCALLYSKWPQLIYFDHAPTSKQSEQCISMQRLYTMYWTRQGFQPSRLRPGCQCQPTTENVQ